MTPERRSSTEPTVLRGHRTRTAVAETNTALLDAGERSRLPQLAQSSDIRRRWSASG